MTRSEIDSLRQDSKAAMKLASALVAENIEPINFARTFHATPKQQVHYCVLHHGPTMPMTTIFGRIVANVLKDVDSPKKRKFQHPKAG